MARRSIRQRGGESVRLTNARNGTDIEELKSAFRAELLVAETETEREALQSELDRLEATPASGGRRRRRSRRSRRPRKSRRSRRSRRRH